MRVWGALAAAAAMLAAAPGYGQNLVLRGGTLVDVSQAGRGGHDVPDAVVVIRDGRIVAAGDAASVPLPAGLPVIDARGKFLTPGLIDGFSTLSHQGFANADLYNGVTSVVAKADTVPDERRGQTFLGAVPSPHVFLLDLVRGYPKPPGNYSELKLKDERLHGVRSTPEQLTAALNDMARRKIRVVLIFYDTWPDQVDQVVAEAARLGIGTMGELGFTSYPYAARAGIQAFVHSRRYLTELAPAEAKLAAADDPFGPAMAKVLAAEGRARPDAAEVVGYADQLARSGVALIPTLTIAASTGLPAFPNPWDAPSSVLIDPKDLHQPIDRKSGRSPVWLGASPEKRREGQALVENASRVERMFHERGVRYLAASATSAFGILPGSGLQQELALLAGLGLTPREVLAAATSNYADAFGWPDVGRLEPGRNGDVLILNRDPRESVDSLKDIAAVILSGKVIDREALLKWRPPAPAR